MGVRGSRIADSIAWEYEKKRREKEKKERKEAQKKEEIGRRERVEIGEEIYIMRKNIYGKGNRHYQKGKVIAKYSKYFSVLFKCKGEESYIESFDYITAKYKKELSKDDNIL